MIHKNLGLVQRSAMKSRKHGGETMIRKAYWGVLASTVLALAFGMGCNSTTASAPPAQVVTITAMTPFAQNAPINNPDVPPIAFASQFNVTVTSNGAPGTGTPGTPVAGVVVTFSAPGAGAGGTFTSVGGSSTASATTNSSGIATSPNFYADGTPGTYNVIASSAITTSTATFYLSNTLQPAPITVAGGSLQSTTEGTQFATPLSVTVLDATANPVSNLVVTFTAPAFTVTAGVPSTASGTFADSGSNITTATTNSSGVATTAAFTANALPDVLPANGPYTVMASIASTAEGDGNTATFTLSNTTMPVGPLVVPVNTTPQSATISTNFAVPLSVTVLDANLNPVTNAIVTFTAPAQPASPAAAIPSGDFYDTTVVPAAYDLLSVTAWTDVNGVATAPAFEANATAGGPYNVTATVVVGGGNPANPPLTTSFALTNNP
jgi:hypothetical protein